jgi:cell division protein FtsN
MADPKDTKPTEQPPASPSPSPPAYIPPRLREKLAESDSAPEFVPRSGPPWGMIITLAVIVIAVVGGIMWYAGSQAKARRAAAVAAEKAAAQARADSIAVVAAFAAAESTRADSIARAAEEAKAAARAAASRPSAYGIVVGTYMFEDKASSSRAELAASTGLSANVTPATEGGTTVYRVVLGHFNSRSAAETKASELLGSSQVTEARVVGLKK